MLVKKPKRSDHPEGLIGDTIFLEEIANYHKARAEFTIAAIDNYVKQHPSQYSGAYGRLVHTLEELKDNE